jgi:heme-degrading monooxygenase HmoA
MWRHLNQLRSSPLEAAGCLDIKAGIVGPNEFVLVSYWQSSEALHAYFKSEVHRRLMKHFYSHPDDLELYNETYHPSHAGKYNAAHGRAKVYPTV